MVLTDSATPAVLMPCRKKSPLLFSDYLCTVKHRSLHTLRMCISVLTHLGIDSLIQKANVHPWPVWRVNAAALLSPDRSGGRYRLLFWVYESEKKLFAGFSNTAGENQGFDFKWWCNAFQQDHWTKDQIKGREDLHEEFRGYIGNTVRCKTCTENEDVQSTLGKRVKGRCAIGKSMGTP